MIAASLARFAASMRDPDPDGVQRAARQAWLERGILVVLPGQLHGLDREFVHALEQHPQASRYKIHPQPHRC